MKIQKKITFDFSDLIKILTPSIEKDIVSDSNKKNSIIRAEELSKFRVYVERYDEEEMENSISSRSSNHKLETKFLKLSFQKKIEPENSCQILETGPKTKILSFEIRTNKQANDLALAVEKNLPTLKIFRKRTSSLKTIIFEGFFL